MCFYVMSTSNISTTKIKFRCSCYTTIKKLEKGAAASYCKAITDLKSFGLMRENDSGGKGPMEDRKGGGKMVGMRYHLQ